MASLNSTITIEFERRPCMVWQPCRNEPDYEKRAFFHQLITRRGVVPPSNLRGGHQGGQVQDVFAVVEYDDGTLGTVELGRVRFLDSDAVFGEYVWPGEKDGQP